VIDFLTNFVSGHAEIIITLVKIALLLFIVLTVNAYLTWFERKVVAHMQSRWGPHRVGPHGLLQPLADGAKFLLKEDPTPAGVDKFTYFLAPLMALALALTSIAIIPFGPDPLRVFGHDIYLGIVDLNVRSTVQLAKLVLVDMARQGSGKVLFTSSIVAGMPGWNQSMYNASKSFVRSFAEALHDEMRATGVTVTSLMPGPTATNFFWRAGMSDTLLARMPKDDPARVARQGYDALMSGDRKVLAASLFSKAMG